MLIAHNYFRLVRPLNVLMMMIGSLLGVWLVVGTDIFEPVILRTGFLAAVVVGLSGVSGNVFNDWLDFEADRVNRPDRPVASGMVSRPTALLIALLSAITSLILASLLGMLHFFIALGVVGSLVVYNLFLKHIPLLGNLCVAALVSLVLLYGGWTQGSSVPLYLGAAFAALTNLAREIVKDIVDIPGDRKVGAGTTGVRWGDRIGSVLAGFIIVLTVFASTLIHLDLAYGASYLIVMLASDLLLITSLGWILDHEFRAAAATIKVAMFSGMIAVGLLV
jgi:geranylgeranylglycerol-phosphate geranylgeranyltransferase